ncbi:MAG: hypothetical protein BroJett042_19440 [Bacteroidota bacterium]|nr:MAG: hypothetical protein BroJett042_19440 [Bacteroidota bacterium]
MTCNRGGFDGNYLDYRLVDWKAMQELTSIEKKMGSMKFESDRYSFMKLAKITKHRFELSDLEWNK